LTIAEAVDLLCNVARTAPGAEAFASTLDEAEAIVRNAV